MMRGIGDLSPTLLALMSAQGGVFSSADARAHGHTDAEVQRLRTAEVLHAVRRGVYTWTAGWAEASPGQRHLMGISALRFGLSAPAVLSHDSAALVHGLAQLRPRLDTLHVSRSFSSGTRIEAGVHHYVAELPLDDVVRSEGAMAVTSRARTAIDIARASGTLEEAVGVCDSALRIGVARQELEAVIERCRTWPGARFLRRAVAIADGRAANPGESWSRVVLIGEGVAPDDLQVEVRDGQGLVGYADFGWQGMVGEFDGRAKYGIEATSSGDVSDALWREKKREDRMRAGHEMVRWTTADLHRPQVLGARVRAGLARAVQRGLRTA